jgi:hypothetical protein
MKKTTLLTLLFVSSSLYLNAQTAKQDFENENKNNTWNYTTNIPFYSNNNDTDLWGQKAANGRIPSAYSGTTFLAGRDLDNPHSQSVTGSPSPEHILNFNPVNIAGLEAEISFRVHYVGLNSLDYIFYQLAYNNGTDWSTYDYSEDVFRTTQNGNFNSTGWEEFKHNVPAGHDFVRMRVVVYQNGNEYLGFDDFEVKTQTLSNGKNTIDGFTFGPNPTNGTLRLKANTNLDNATIYNLLGKELMNVKGSSREMKLDFSNFSSGIYLIRVQSGDSSQTVKIINI